MAEESLFPQIVEHTAAALGYVGVAFIVAGTAFAFAHYLRATLLRSKKAMLQVRLTLGTYILVGLEFMVGQDIVETAVEVEFEHLIGLGIIVVVRTVLEYFLGKEVEHLDHEISHATGPDSAGSPSGWWPRRHQQSASPPKAVAAAAPASQHANPARAALRSVAAAPPPPPPTTPPRPHKPAPPPRAQFEEELETNVLPMRKARLIQDMRRHHKARSNRNSRAAAGSREEDRATSILPLSEAHVLRERALSESPGADKAVGSPVKLHQPPRNRTKVLRAREAQFVAHREAASMSS